MHVLAPGRVGGLESVVKALAAGQRDAGHRVAVAAILEGPPPAPGEHAFLDHLREARVETVIASLSGRGYARERAFIAQACARFRPDVVHTHGHRPDVVDAVAARNAGALTVSTIHGFTHTGWRKPVYEYLQFRALRRSDAVVAVSRPVLERLRARGIAEARSHLIPNAYVADRSSVLLSRAEARRALGVTGDGFVIGWVGRLSVEKGADRFVDALARLADPRVTAVIIGDGRERSVLEARAASAGLGSRIHWAGIVPSARSMMAAFDLLVLSSRSEGTPIVLFEAMAAGVPIVATAVGGVPDMLSTDEALLVTPERPDLLAAAIAAARDDPDAAAVRARHAAERLASSYAPGPWLERHSALYAGLVDRRRSMAVAR